MKSNPEKCAFGVASGKFLGFLVSNRGIEVNPAQIKAIEEIPDILTSKKEVQRLTGAGLGIVLIPPSGESIRQAIKCYPITNNEAEYEVVIAGLKLAREISIEQIMIKNDSQLVVNQMQGTYTAREARMQQYLEKAGELVRQFQSWKVVQIPREANVEADALDNLALVAEVTSEENATYGIVPEGKKESQRLRQKAARYCLIRENLYRKIFGGPLARCLGHNQMEYVMREVHEGHWGNHAEAGAFKQVREKEQIKRITSSPYHPMENGQAESTNKIIINNLKKRLEKSKGNWPEELPGVLWAYRTTAKTTTGETPFSLVYGSEALIPVEIGEPSTRFTLAMEE
nr:uncharacterized protein LOC117277313 [Nicotiana tomentosiformis]